MLHSTATIQGRSISKPQRLHPSRGCCDVSPQGKGSGEGFPLPFCFFPEFIRRPVFRAQKTRRRA
jgi:hypothetical protein